MSAVWFPNTSRDLHTLVPVTVSVSLARSSLGTQSLRHTTGPAWQRDQVPGDTQVELTYGCCCMCVCERRMRTHGCECPVCTVGEYQYLSPGFAAGS